MDNFLEYLRNFSENDGKNKITYNGIEYCLTKFKKKKIKKLKIQKHEELCPECIGWGLIDVFSPIVYDGNNNHYYYHNIYKCIVCNGTGKIDWLYKIKNLINVKEYVFDEENKIIKYDNLWFVGNVLNGLFQHKKENMKREYVLSHVVGH